MYVGISGYFSVPLPDRISLAYQLRSEIRTQKVQTRTQVSKGELKECVKAPPELFNIQN